MDALTHFLGRYRTSYFFCLPICLAVVFLAEICRSGDFSAVTQLATNPFPANFSGIDFSNRFERFSMGRFIMKQSAPEAALSDYFT
jgi:hypothetical protein